MVYPRPVAPRQIRPSLKPQGLCGWAFVLARVINFICLFTLVAFIGSFLSLPASDKQGHDTSFIATLVLTNLALFWSVVSWSGYSKRHIRFAITWTADLAFVIAFIGHIALTGVFLQNGQMCSATSKPTPAVCPTLTLVWYLSIGNAVLFAISGFSVGWVHLNAGESRSTALDGVVVDRSGDPQPRNRGSPSHIPAHQYRYLTAMDFQYGDHGGASVAQAHIGNAEPTSPIPCHNRELHIALDPIEDPIPQQTKRDNTSASHQSATTASGRPSGYRHTNSDMMSFRSEPHIRERSRLGDRRHRSHGKLKEAPSSSSRSGTTRWAPRTKGKQAAAEILSGAGKVTKSERLATAYFDSLRAATAAQTPTRSFSPVSWTGNTTCSSDDEAEAEEDRGNTGKIPIRLSTSPPTTPVSTLPKTTYLMPPEAENRPSSSVYETEYASSSDDDPTPKATKGNAFIRRPPPSAQISQPARPTGNPTSDQRLEPAPWSRAVQQGSYYNSKNDALTHSRPRNVKANDRVQEAEATSKPKKSWWMFGLGGDSADTHEFEMEPQR